MVAFEPPGSSAEDSAVCVPVELGVAGEGLAAGSQVEVMPAHGILNWVVLAIHCSI